MLLFAAAILGGCPSRTGFGGLQLTPELGDGIPSDGDPGDAAGDGDDLGDGDGGPPAAKEFRLQYDRAWLIVARNLAMTPLIVDSAAPATFSVTPQLPNGLRLDANDGSLSGTPTVLLQPFVTFTITAVSGDFVSTTTLDLAVVDALIVDTTSDVAPSGTLGDGVCAPAGQCSIRAALAEANAFAGVQMVSVGPGIYSLSTPITLGNDALLGSQSGGTIIDATPLIASALVVPAGTTAYVASFELSSGSDATTGGGCAEVNGTLLASHLNVHDCNANFGGAFLVAGGGNLEVEASLMTDNAATTGAAFEVLENASLVVRTSAFTDNNAESGGVFTVAGSAVIERCYFGDNSAQSGGGVLHVEATGDASVASSTFEGNHAISASAGALLTEGLLTVRYSTFGGNTAAVAGSVIAVPTSSGSATLRGCFLFSQPQPCDDVGFGFTSDGYNVLDGPLATCPDLSAATDRVSAALGAFDGSAVDNGGLTLSVAIDPASDVADIGDLACPAVDQRGEPRPQSPFNTPATCDAGAYENDAVTF